MAKSNDFVARLVVVHGFSPLLNVMGEIAQPYLGLAPNTHENDHPGREKVKPLAQG
jgi:hypothetical protein